MNDKIDEALGVAGPFKMPAQELVNSGQCPTSQEDFGDLNDAEKDYE